MKGLGQVFKAVASAMVGVGKKEDLTRSLGLHHCRSGDDSRIYCVGDDSS